MSNEPLAAAEIIVWNHYAKRLFTKYLQTKDRMPFENVEGFLNESNATANT